jgi:lipopolysaccharide export system permease protein
MKKILFRKLLLDCMLFFLIALFSTSIIIWIFQAVNFLDIIVEDGRDYLIYLNFSLLNFPKIISKIFPFALFFSFFYVISKYELSNELMIFWNFGVRKIELTNFFILISIILTFIQLLMTTLIVPETLKISRSLIRTSNVDFFGSFVKQRKFNDNIEGLTIYAEEKNKNGKLKNIYLKKNEDNNDFQITIAKKGEFKNTDGSQLLILYNGQTINKVNDKITNFYFSKSDFNLSLLKTVVVTDDKIQETRTIDHVECIKNFYNKNLTFKSEQQEYLKFNCSKDALDDLFQELYKRFIVPMFTPILILVSLFLIILAKENKFYQKFRLIIFLIGVATIIISETLLRFINVNFLFNIKIITIPFLLFSLFYIIFYFSIKSNISINSR